MSEVDYVDAAENEPEVEVNPLADLVDAALAKDYNKANEIFGQAISVKLDDVMDQERIRLSNAIYNASGEEDEEDEVERHGEIEDEYDNDGLKEESVEDDGAAMQV